MTLLKRFQKVNSFESIILKDLSEKVAILYPNIDGVSNSCNCREKGITNKDFVSTFGKIIKNSVSFQGINSWDTNFTINSFNTIYYIYWFLVQKLLSLK
jgi:hypothetical protein